MGSAISNVVKVQVSASLSSPILAAADPLIGADGAQIALAWNVVAGATSYQLYRSVDGGAWALYQTLSAPGYTDVVTIGPVDFGSVYAYYVVAASNSAASGPSNPVTVVIDAGV